MPHVFKLNNGLTCICDERLGSGKISIDISIKGGAIHEKNSEKGLTFLMHKALLGGSSSKTRSQIVEFIEQKGGAISSTSARQSSGLEVSFLARYIDDVMPVFVEVFKSPSFDKADIDMTKARILKQIEQRSQQPAARASDGFFEALLGDTGKSTMGSDETLPNLTVEQIKERHATLLLNPSNIVLSFAGDIAKDKAEALALKYFDDLKPSVTTRPEKILFNGQDIREATENEQMNILFGFEAPAGTSEERYAYLLLNELLSGGMASPLFQEIREKRGLVYSVSASYSGLDDVGVFLISAGTGKGNVGELIKVTFELLGAYLEEGAITLDALEHASVRIIRDLKRRLESSDFASSYQAEQMLRYGVLRSFEDLEISLGQVKPAHIQKAVFDMLSSGSYALSNVGPQATMPSKQDIEDMMAKQLIGKQEPTVVGLKAFKPADVKLVSAKKISAVKPQVTVLENGLTIVTDQRPGSVSIGAWVKAGSDHETEKLNGATHMNEHMMFRGTPSFGPGEIDKLVELELGGDLNAYTSKDKTAYYFYNLLPEHLDKVVHICGDMVFEANIFEEEFDGKMEAQPDGTQQKGKGERDVVIEEIRKYADEVNSVRWCLMDSLAYPEQTHGRPILGTEGNIRAMTTEDLRLYRDEFYAPNTVVFSCAGPISHQDFVATVKARYEGLKPSNCNDLPTPDYKGGTGFILSDDAKANTIAYSVQTVPEGDDKIYAYQALEEVLGGGQSSRLHEKLVNELQLVPNVGAGQMSFYNVGQFIVFTSVEVDKTEEVLSVIFAELQGVVDNLTQAELDKAKVQIEIQLLEDMETNMNTCRVHGEEALKNGQPFDMNNVINKIQKLVLSDVSQAAQQILSTNPTLAMVAPKDTDPKKLPDHARVIDLKNRQTDASSLLQNHG